MGIFCEDYNDSGCSVRFYGTNTYDWKCCFYNRLAYVKNAPKRGGVVIFWSDEVNCLLGKRIIGVGGDKDEFTDGQVIINGHYTDESAYIDDKIKTYCDKTFEVPEGCYFMLGDNRGNSIDSRYWKQCYIPRGSIKGRYTFPRSVDGVVNVLYSTPITYMIACTTTPLSRIYILSRSTINTNWHIEKRKSIGGMSSFLYKYQYE